MPPQSIIKIFQSAGNRRRSAEGLNHPWFITWTVAFLIVVAGCLRFYGISKESLWFDEAFSVQFSSSLSNALAGERTNPPFYYVLLHFWMSVFGSSEAGVRSLSVIPSLISIILTYLIGKRLYNKPTGLLAAAFMAFSTFQISYAQEARAYALLTALLLASMLFMDIALRSQAKSRSMWAWFGYFVFTVAALHTHFYAVFFV
ncbi:MAG TPA: hypothetical protein ENO27_01230, partial [Caldithrix sp.]|nr:hypothetical protein [Caldithrix sp.]